jgi:hypothetical protein
MNSVVTAVQKRALDESGMTTAEYAVGPSRRAALAVCSSSC